MNSKPYFKFRVNTKNNFNKDEAVFVFADAYDIKYGALTFYQLVGTNVKEKMAVLSFPEGKWESCALMSLDNSPAFENAENNLGISSSMRQNDARRDTTSIIESELKRYITGVASFDIDLFMKHLQSTGVGAKETEVQWAVSGLLKKKQIQIQKFLQPDKIKTLDIHAQNLVRRQWDGKIKNIYDVLKDREETKNVSIIDLTVWLLKNQYLT